MNQHIFQVSEFTEFINTYLDQVGEAVVEGEISQLNVSQNKWLFVTIKDEQASVEVFGMIFQLSGWRQLEEGMLVRVYGRPRLYKKSGRFSLFAREIIPSGEGALRIAFEKLKRQLEAEGLFASERKRPLPLFPQHIGLITAKGSQAYNDFVKVLVGRMGGIRISFYPVSVQGVEAVPSILSAFSYFSRCIPQPEVLILIRGGGSLDDLSSFNDERVVRAIFASPIPVVCGVGHEGDVSLADLVADLRASTPSHAAELLVRERDAVTREIEGAIRFMEQSLRHRLMIQEQRVSRSTEVLRRAVEIQLQSLHRAMRAFSSQCHGFTHRVREASRQQATATAILFTGVRFWLTRERQRLDGLIRLLESLDYRRVLTRGYSITRDDAGEIIRSVTTVGAGHALATTVADGTIRSRVIER